MRIAAPAPIRPLRLARYFLWAWLWLVKHALFLLDGSPDARRQLDKMGRFVARIIFLKAASILRYQARPRLNRPRGAPMGFRKCERPRNILRAAIGVSLRRRLRGRTPGERLAGLFEALVRADALARTLARRLRRRLTRLCPIIAIRPPSDALCGAPFAPPAPADSS